MCEIRLCRKIVEKPTQDREHMKIEKKNPPLYYVLRLTRKQTLLQIITQNKSVDNSPYRIDKGVLRTPGQYSHIM